MYATGNYSPRFAAATARSRASAMAAEMAVHLAHFLRSTAPKVPPVGILPGEDVADPVASAAFIVNAASRASATSEVPIDHHGRPLPKDSIAAFIVACNERRMGHAP